MCPRRSKTVSHKLLRKIFVFVLLLFVVIATTFSPLFTTLDTEHSCHNHAYNNDDVVYICRLCELIKRSENHIRALGVAASISFDGLFVAAVILYAVAYVHGSHTLVSLKTRMNN